MSTHDAAKLKNNAPKFIDGTTNRFTEKRPEYYKSFKMHAAPRKTQYARKN